jgi:hypothetical protein
MEAFMMRTLILLLGLFVAPSANADMLYSAYDQHRENSMFQAYFDGVTNGVFWANAMAESQSDALYCPPAKMEITRDQYVDILDRYMASLRADNRNGNVGHMLLRALQHVRRQRQ